MTLQYFKTIAILGRNLKLLLIDPKWFDLYMGEIISKCPSNVLFKLKNLTIKDIFFHRSSLILWPCVGAKKGGKIFYGQRENAESWVRGGRMSISWPYMVLSLRNIERFVDLSKLEIITNGIQF